MIRDTSFDRALRDGIEKISNLAERYIKRDVASQKSVYLVDPQGGEVRLGSIAAVAGLAAISVTLLGPAK
jgi:hypothetical protein